MFYFTLLFPIVSFHLPYIIVFVFFSLWFYVSFVLFFPRMLHLRGITLVIHVIPCELHSDFHFMVSTAGSSSDLGLIFLVEIVTVVMPIACNSVLIATFLSCTLRYSLRLLHLFLHKLSLFS